MATQMISKHWLIRTGLVRYRVAMELTHAREERLHSLGHWFVLRRRLTGRDGESLRILAEVAHALGCVAGRTPVAATGALVSATRATPLLDRIELAVRGGRLSIEELERPAVPELEAIHHTAVVEEAPEELIDDSSTWFEVIVVDEVGQAVPGVAVCFDSAGKGGSTPTDGNGKARFTGMSVSAGTLKLTDVPTVRRLLERRWEEPRSGTPPAGQRVISVELGDKVAPICLESQVPTTIVLLPPPTFIEVTVEDEDGNQIVGRPWRLELPGGVTHEGELGKGIIRYTGVQRTQHAVFSLLPEGTPVTADAAEAQTGATSSSVTVPDEVVVPASPPASCSATPPIEPPRETKPSVTCVRLFGMHFDTEKCFLLPGCMPSIKQVKQLYDQQPGAQVLVVGHTDATGSVDYNRTLSEERARSAAAFLSDDVDAWTAWFDASRAGEKRWGTREIQSMLSALPDGAEPKFYTGAIDGDYGRGTTAAVKSFQSWSNQNRGTSLEVDGDAGPLTRRELVASYMAIDGTSLPVGTKLATHGCSEFHLVVPDDHANERNRRVEVFFFEGAISPPPQGSCPAPDGCSEWAEWHRKVTTTVDISGDGSPVVAGVKLKMRLHDAQARLMPGTEYRVRLSGLDSPRTADGNAWAELELPAEQCFASIVVEWGPLGDGVYQYANSVIVECEGGTPKQKAWAQLGNLGYDVESDYSAAVEAFQTDHKLPPTGPNADGSLPDGTRKELDRIYGEADCVATPLA